MLTYFFWDRFINYILRRNNRLRREVSHFKLRGFAEPRAAKSIYERPMITWCRGRYHKNGHSSLFFFRRCNQQPHVCRTILWFILIENLFLLLRLFNFLVIHIIFNKNLGGIIERRLILRLKIMVFTPNAHIFPLFRLN